MTIAERIKQMDIEELVDLIEWNMMPDFSFKPECDEGCEDECGGCAVDCPHSKRERAVREWLDKEYC